MMLQRDHSLTLLQSLIRLEPEANFLKVRSDRTILSEARSFGSSFGDPRSLLALLQPQQEAVEHEAQRYIVKTLKQNGSRCRE